MNKILVVEDDKDIALALGTRLRAAGFKVSNAYDALGGVSRAVKDQPDLVILDLMMPAGGGIKVAERIRALEATATVPIIFITASQDPGLRNEAMAFDPHAFVEKPYDPATLLEKVHEALGMAANVSPRTPQPLG